MIDINLIRNNSGLLYDVFKKRNEDTTLLEKTISFDKKLRNLRKREDKLRFEKNNLSKKISELKKQGKKGINSLVKESSEISKKIEKITIKRKKLEQKLYNLLLSFPNLIDDDVPVGETEEDNIPLKFWGKCKVWKGYLETFKDQVKDNYVDYFVVDKKPIHHADLVEMYNLVDTEKASEISASRTFILKNQMVLLKLALMLHAANTLYSKNFKMIQPPYFVRRYVEEGATTLDAFKDALYKLKDEDLFLIPTSEHPLASLNANKVFSEKDLPIFYGGYSPCFRKEAGSHGKDTKGIFRVHHFDKIEQYAVCLPKDSNKILEKLTENAEKLLQSLNVPYRKVILCTGDMDGKVKKQYDLEGWFPSLGRFRELGSYGNVGDWQARRFKIRYIDKNEKKYVHTVYATFAVSTRLPLAILENNMDENGIIHIPKVLHKYLPFKEIKV